MTRYRLVIIVIFLSVILSTAFYMLFISLPRLQERTTVSSTRGKPSIGEVNYAELYVLVDNHEFDDFSSPWGISMLLKTPHSTILFDAGPSPEALERNSYKLGIDLSKLDFAVASHEHGDHIGGFSYVASLTKGLTVYVPRDMTEYSKNELRGLGLNLVEVDETRIIAEGVAVVGELSGPPWEQALAVNVKGLGLIILVGCSHPGVDRIVEKASKDLEAKPYAVIGGFHLGGASEEHVREIVENFKLLGVQKIYPIHCSGERIMEVLQRECPELYGDGHVGTVIKFTSS